MHWLKKNIQINQEVIEISTVLSKILSIPRVGNILQLIT